MKIIDENGAAIETPDLTLGYLVDDTEPVEHPAVEGVEEVSHYETVAEYPNGGMDVRKVIDVPGVPAQAAWTEQVPIQKYIRYTAEELAYFKKLLTGRSFELPVAVDIEDEVQKPLGKAALTDLTAHMLSTVESWGVYAMLYTGLWFGSTFLYMGGAELKPYDVWLAAYRTRKPAPGWPFGMWQYTSTARVPGVSTNVDMSHAYKDYAAIIKRAGLGAVKGV